MGAELLFSRVGPELFAVRRDGGRWEEVWLDGPDPDRRAGNLLKLKAVNVLPGIQAAFLGMAQEPNAYLNAADLTLPEERTSGRLRGERIERRLAEGRDLLVRVDREELDDKGPRVRSDLSLPGRHLVYFPDLDESKISRRVRDSGDRQRLLAMAQRWGGEGAWVFRTVAASAPEECIEQEANALLEAWQRVLQLQPDCRAPAVLHREPDLHLRLLRDLDPAEVERVVLDHEEDYQEARLYAESTAPGWAPLLERHPVGRSVFEDFELNQALDRAVRRKIWLKSGGTLAIDETEALVSIDVNTGRNLGRNSATRTVDKTNLEAAAEVARQIRLRDLGGMIVVDFIDMDTDAARVAVVQALEKGLVGDPSRSKIGRFSDLGLLEISRNRRRANLRTLLSEDARSLGIDGRRPNPRRIALEIYRNLLDEGATSITAHPDVVAELDRSRKLGLRSSVSLDCLELRESRNAIRERFQIGS